MVSILFLFLTLPFCLSSFDPNPRKQSAYSKLISISQNKNRVLCFVKLPLACTRKIIAMSRLDMDEATSTQRGKVHGPFVLENLVCQTNHMLTSRGVFLGSNPLKYAMPLLLLQMAAIIITSRLLYRLLKPLNQGMISAQVLVITPQ